MTIEELQDDARCRDRWYREWRDCKVVFLKNAARIKEILTTVSPKDWEAAFGATDSKCSSLLLDFSIGLMGYSDFIEHAVSTIELQINNLIEYWYDEHVYRLRNDAIAAIEAVEILIEHNTLFKRIERIDNESGPLIRRHTKEFDEKQAHRTEKEKEMLGVICDCALESLAFDRASEKVRRCNDCNGEDCVKTLVGNVSDWSVGIPNRLLGCTIAPKEWCREDD